MIEKMRCKQCGERARFGREKQYYNPETGEESYCFYIYCPRCKLRTKVYITAREAREAWNNGVYKAGEQKNGERT